MWGCVKTGYRFFSSLSFHIGPTSFAPNIIVFRSGPLKGWIVLASLFRVVSIWVFWSNHQCNTIACADAGPICQIKPIIIVFIFCRWVGKMTVVKLEWRLLGFAGTGKLPGKKWLLGWENHFVKLESGGCWDLMGFLLLRCLLSKRLVVLAYIGGLSFFFLPYRFGGVGERGMVLLHVNDPPFFTTPCGILQEAKRCKKMVSHFPWNLAEHILGIRIISYTFVYYNTSLT